MQRNRFWIEIIALGTMIACALALLIATLGAGAAAMGGQDVSVAPPQTSPVQAAPQANASQANNGPAQTYQGMITCSHCGAKHPAKLGGAAASCTLACVHSGAAFALIDGEKVYQLNGDLNLLKRFAGQRAEITGFAHGSTIEVSTVAST
jgi:hypothetical protein